MSFVLTERFPELDKLNAEEKLILAGELWRDATSSESMVELSEEAIAAIEARLDHYLRNPDSGISWSALEEHVARGENR